MTDIDIFGIEPHPAAEVFPMLPDDELDELAADIRTHGLLMPLLVGRVDGQLVLVDGRNRREACRRVGVTPTYSLLLDGEDLVGYIVSANINRRHMTKGQRATATAKLKPETTMGRNSDVKELANNSGVSSDYLRKARFVLRYASDLSDAVLNGSTSLEDAYQEARIRKERLETHESRFERLKAVAPDLAEMVVEEKLNLEEAEAAEREREERSRRRKKLLVEALHALSAHAYLINKTSHAEVMQLITQEAELYKQHNCGPVDEFIEALEIFEHQAGVLLNKIRGEDDVEKS